MKMVAITDFLTAAQIKQALAIFRRNPVSPAKEICTQVIEPNIVAINEKLGQENDAYFLGYLCEYAFRKASEGSS